MNSYEKRITKLLKRHHDEEEALHPYFHYRLNADSALFNNAIESQGDMCDILSFMLVKNEETGQEDIELFISTPNDDEQGFIYFHDLQREEQELVFFRLSIQVFNQFGVEI